MLVTIPKPPFSIDLIDIENLSLSNNNESLLFYNYASCEYNATCLLSKYVDMNSYIGPSFLYNIMKCCPADKYLKEEWDHELESETSIDENEIDKLCNVFKVLSNPSD